MVRFNSAVSYLSDYYAGLMDELRTLIPQLGSNIRFEDDIWFCDKQKKSEGMPSSKFTLYFNVVPEKYRDMIKYFSLHVDSSLTTIKGDISRTNTFLKFLEQECGGVALKHVNPSHIKLYQSYLEITYAKLGTKSALYRSIYKFFRTMNNWPEFPAINPVKRKNPWTRTLQEQKNSNKLIPEHVVITLDQVFRDENLPLYFRVLYWIMRSIPSRVSEVTSMSLECLKPYGPNYALFIPTWKQNGSHMEPEIRVIHIKDEGHGEYLLNLIRQQQEASRKLQYLLPENKKNYLFTCYKYIWVQCKNNYVPAVKKGPIIYNSDYAGNLFKRICKKIQLKDEMGIPYVITSHQLRHNGITDRLEEGFKLIEVRDMTGHKSDSMLYQAYYHPKPEKHLEKQKELITDDEIAVAKMKNPPIYFRGRILNLSEEIEKKILDNPRAYQIGDGNRCLGFCTDILNCREGAFKCLDCEHFSPNGDELDYYEQGIEFWESKVKESIEKGFRLYQENAEYNLALHRHIVERIKSINC